MALDWSGKRSGAVTIEVGSGDWPTGLYAVRLTTEDGRVGFAPFVIRPNVLGSVRQLVVLPTNTWQAYNFYDRDGDGWGDTWYAGGSPPVELDRPYRDRGVPPRFKRYDLGFLKWLQWTAKTPDVVADDDLEAFASGDDLRALYDLVVFPGHSEYMTGHAYDVVERYRDLGGRLVFLSANNFFWKVEKEGQTMRRVKLWRNDGRPEARLYGVQYRANDDGTRQGTFEVVAAEAVPWLFEGTGLANGSRIGEMVGGYGIEIDAMTPDSPPGNHGDRQDLRPLRSRAERRDVLLRDRRRCPRVRRGRPRFRRLGHLLADPADGGQPVAPHARGRSRRRAPARRVVAEARVSLVACLTTFGSIRETPH